MTEQDDLVELGRRLKDAARRIRPQGRAAEAAGVALPTWQRYLSGEREPGFLAIAHFARAAGVSLDWLAYGREAAVFDEALLVEMILRVEGYVSSQTWAVPPTAERKARLITYLYGEVLRERAAAPASNPPAVDPERIHRLFALLT